jgi:TOMM system kinase/cyclase fusion protein
MDLLAVVDQVIELLRSRGRVSYRVLKLQLQLDDDAIEALKDELIYAHHVAADEDGRVLVWTGGPGAPTAPAATPSPPGPSGREADLPAEVIPRRADARGPDAERRQLTVLFCDLVDSTVLASRLDPEEWREVVRAYQETCAKVIARYEGHIAQYLGDGLLVYFGYPSAHEDDAQRAVRAGLGMVEAVRVLTTRIEREKGIQLAVRIGIHTGLVVVGEIGASGRHEQLALGDTPNVAARLQGLAAPDTVAISAATHRLVQGYFTMAALSPQVLKGVAAPVPVYRILGASTAQSRLDVTAATGLTPLVGRESEVALLLERWTQSQAGLGQVVLLSGEGGIGKSRLVEVLRERVVGEGSPCIALRCSPYHTHSALYPAIEHLQRWLQFQRNDTPEEKLRKLEEVLARTGVQGPSPSIVSLLAALLSVPLPEGRYPPVLLSPQQQRQRTLDALVGWLLAEAERQTVLAVWEDLHWADPSTLEFLSLLIDQTPTARLLTLCTCRPEFRPPWTPRSFLTHLTLGRLGRAQVETMLERITGGKALPAEVVQQIVAKTDGVPLFVEELTKMVLESGLLQEREDHYALTGPLPRMAIPATLHDALMARLDRLATVREVAQLGAMIGRTFAYELLQAVASLDDTTLQHGLRQLVDAELVYQRGVPPQATYTFKHALIQEAAYQSLLRSTRQRHHQRIAQVLEARFPEVCETQPELLAHHYTEAGLMEQAIPYWQQAGQRAVGRSAHVEAIGHLTKALEALDTLPKTTELIRQELAVQLALGPALMVTRGFTAPEVAATYGRARQLCEDLGDRQQLFPILFGLWRSAYVRAQLPAARALGEQLLRLAASQADPALLVDAHGALGQTLCIQGELTLAREHLQQVVALYEPQQHLAMAFRFGYDPGVYARAVEGWVLWLLGYPEQALRRSQDALTMARELSHPFTLALTLVTAAALHQMRQEEHATLEHVKASMALSSEHGFPYLGAIGTVRQGWGLARLGRVEDGIAHMRQGLAALRATETELSHPYHLALLAEACGRGGQIEAGLCALEEALVAADQHAERLYKAELQRLKGELLLRKSVAAACIPAPTAVPDGPAGSVGSPGQSSLQMQAQACFRTALDIARRQQAKSWELRAAMSLSRLWQQQGKRAEARALLAPVYGWFTEGFDTAALREAKALLETLGG